MSHYSKLGINGINVNEWLTTEPMKGLIEGIHQASLEAGQKVYGRQTLPPDVAAAVNAAAYAALMDDVLISRTLIEYNNDMLALQLASLGLDLSRIPTPPPPAGHE